MKNHEQQTIMRWRRAVGTVLPAVMPVAMRSVFSATTNRFGRRRGYQAGFAIYWATCWASAAATIGPRRLIAAFQRNTHSVPAPRALSIAVLAFPAVGAVLTQFLPNVRRAGPRATATAIGVGLTNALAEEVFWRAMPVALFPDDPVRGWLWPAAGFTAWHLVPLRSVRADPGRIAMLLFGAGFIGLGYGWVVFKSHSVVTALGPHAITDASGARMAKTMWLDH
jgi:membrane protease YdiL (CAAX protease family)